MVIFRGMKQGEKSTLGHFYIRWQTLFDFIRSSIRMNLLRGQNYEQVVLDLCTTAEQPLYHYEVPKV